MSLSHTHLLIALAVSLAALSAALHALLYKRDPRSALGWIAVCLIFPVAGPLLYYLFGINRIRSRAAALGGGEAFHLDGRFELARGPRPEVDARIASVARAADNLARRPLLAGNRVEALRDGSEAYPAMLEAIAQARRRVYLTTYIFQCDRIGARFTAALAAARERGVEVKVVIDGFGELYSLPRLAGRELRRRSIPHARFLPPRLLPPQVFLNLRTHRKLLVTDGELAFLGGLNISDKNLPPPGGGEPAVRDLHFRLRGPVVSQLERAFLEDWGFCTGERDIAPSDRTLPGPAAEPGSVCRSILDGPHEPVQKIKTVLLAAIAAARHRIALVTPYFLPPREMIGALQAAALRGVAVEIVLPERSNLPFVDRATRNMLWELLGRGVAIYLQPAPFDHTKLALFDDLYALVGSPNLDPRSLRLNFEIALEIYDREVAVRLATLFEQRRERARRLTLEEVDSRPLPVHLGDALCWLFTPYL